MDTPRRIQTGMTTHALVTLQHSPRKEPVPAWPLRVMNYSKFNIDTLWTLQLLHAICFPGCGWKIHPGFLRFQRIAGQTKISDSIPQHASPKEQMK